MSTLTRHQARTPNRPRDASTTPACISRLHSRIHNTACMQYLCEIRLSPISDRSLLFLHVRRTPYLSLSSYSERHAKNPHQLPGPTTAPQVHASAQFATVNAASQFAAFLAGSDTGIAGTPVGDIIQRATNRTDFHPRKGILPLGAAQPITNHSRPLYPSHRERDDADHHRLPLFCSHPHSRTSPIAAKARFESSVNLQDPRPAPLTTPSFLAPRPPLQV